MTLLLVTSILAAVVAAAWSLRGLGGSSRVAVAAVLASCAAAFNVVVPIPNLEATTTIVVCTTLVLGLRMGAGVGVLAVVATGVSGGIGVWTSWQVLATVLIAGLAAALAPVVRRVAGVEGVPTASIVLIVIAAVLAYDVVLTASSLWLWGGAAVAGGGTGLVAMLLIGLPYTLVHLVASASLTAFAARPLVGSLARFERRLAVVVEPSVSGHREPARR